MKIAICDDERREISKINQLVIEYMNCNFTKSEIEVLSFENSVELATQIEGGKHFDIFILDIVMPVISGIELAEVIRKSDNVTKIIFLTSSPEFAVKSYSVEAFYYLLKPVQKDKLLSVLERACNDIRLTLKQYIVIKTHNNLSKVFFHDLIYVEVMGRTIYFHQKNGAIIESANTISQIEEILLADNRFIKTHRSFIVNLDYVRTLEKNGFIVTSNKFIPVSRNVFKEVKQKFFNYLL